MAGIPENQLATWSNIGDSATAARTGQAVRDVLKSSRSDIAGRNFAIYLQGSYKNSTNTRIDSDVDVVVQLRETYGYDISALNQRERAEFDRQFIPATHTVQQFRLDVLSTLQRAFGSRVTPHNKCLKISKQPGYLDADVVPCENYFYYPGNTLGSTLPKPVEGMRFYTARENREIINWPRIHYDCGVDKQANTGNYYKPTVRLFKNFRNWLEDNHRIDPAPPSYFVECLLYNVPNNSFGNSYFMTTANVLAWLHQEYTNSYYASFTTANGFAPLFDDSEDTWNVQSAWAFVAACCKAWNEW